MDPQKVQLAQENSNLVANNLKSLVDTIILLLLTKNWKGLLEFTVNPYVKVIVILSVITPVLVSSVLHTTLKQKSKCFKLSHFPPLSWSIFISNVLAHYIPYLD